MAANISIKDHSLTSVPGKRGVSRAYPEFAPRVLAPPTPRAAINRGCEATSIDRPFLVMAATAAIHDKPRRGQCCWRERGCSDHVSPRHRLCCPLSWMAVFTAMTRRSCVLHHATHYSLHTRSRKARTYGAEKNRCRLRAYPGSFRVAVGHERATRHVKIRRMHPATVTETRSCYNV